MRSRPLKIFLAVACLFALSAGSLVTLLVFRAATHRCLKNALSAAGRMAVSQAQAEEMKFTPLSSDSVSSLERSGRHSNRGSSSAAPIPPGAPTPPTSPGVTVTPPQVVIGKSGDIMRVGSDIEVGRDEVVTGDVLAVGGDLKVQGHIEGNAVSVGGDIYLDASARVDGDVVCMGGELHEDPGATVGGKRVVGLGRNRVRVSRPLRRHDFDVDMDHDNGLGQAFGWLLLWLLVGWMVVKITPGRTQAAVDSFRQSGGSAFLVGWLALVLIIPGLIAVALLTALLCITIIGIPLGIALLFAYFLLLAVFSVWGGVVGAALVGERVATRQGQMHPTLMRATMTGVLALAGAQVIATLMQVIHVPVFSGFGKLFGVVIIILSCLVGVAGWGALFRSEFTTGWIGRWWSGRRASQAAPLPPPPPGGPMPAGAPAGMGSTVVTTVTTPAPVAPPPAPPPPAPPESYMPPPAPREPEPPASTV